MSYRFVPEQINVDFPENVKLISDEYERHGFEYTLDPDKDMETWKEMVFEKRVRENPETLKKEVICVYRIRDENEEKEYMLYKLRKTIKGGDPIAIWIGKRPRFDTVPVTDDQGNVVNKRISKWNMVYTIEWSTKAFDEIMKDGKKSTKLYIADSSDEYHTNCTGKTIMIKELDKYREMTHDELIIYDEKLKVENQAKQKGK